MRKDCTRLCQVETINREQRREICQTDAFTRPWPCCPWH